MEEIEDIGRRGFGELIFLLNIKPSLFWGTKKVALEEGFGKVYMIFSNLLYVLIIFLKLKIY